MIREFCRWLAATSLSEHIQDIFWVIPTVQIVHIVSIAIVMTSDGDAGPAPGRNRGPPPELH